MHQEHADHAAPEEAEEGAHPGLRDQATDEGRHGEAEEHPEREELADELRALVGGNVGGVLGDARGDVVVAEEPADVRVAEAADPAQDAGLTACVRGMRIELVVGMLVVAAVRGHPPEERALHGHRTADRGDPGHRSGGLERLVRVQAVVADGDAHRRHEVADDEHRHVGPGEVAAPRVVDGDGERDGRQHDRHERQDLDLGGHLALVRRAVVMVVVRIDLVVVVAVVRIGVGVMRVRVLGELRGLPRVKYRHGVEA